MASPTIDDTHIRISKTVYWKFKHLGLYGQTADNILDSLIDFYLENKVKPGVKDRKNKARRLVIRWKFLFNKKEGLAVFHY